MKPDAQVAVEAIEENRQLRADIDRKEAAIQHRDEENLRLERLLRDSQDDSLQLKREIERITNARKREHGEYVAEVVRLQAAIKHHQQQIKQREDGRRVSSVAADHDLWAVLALSEKERGA